MTTPDTPAQSVAAQPADAQAAAESVPGQLAAVHPADIQAAAESVAVQSVAGQSADAQPAVQSGAGQSSAGQSGAARLAVVTGAASGIGRATALRLARDGWHLTLVDRDASGLDATAAQIQKRHDASAVRDQLVADLADTGQTESVVSAYLRSHDVDLLVNNAGVGFRANAEGTTDEQWDVTLAVNLTAMFRLCRAVIPGMVARGHGVIINTASAGGLVGLRYRVAYCASKAGVIGLTRALAADHAGQGIRVNAIAPGTVDTEWVGRMLHDDPDPVATRRMMEQRQLDGRFGTPEEVAGGIAFMAGDEGRFFNGSVMVMDAGLTAV